MLSITQPPNKHERKVLRSLDSHNAILHLPAYSYNAYSIRSRTHFSSSGVKPSGPLSSTPVLFGPCVVGEQTRLLVSFESGDGGSCLCSDIWTDASTRVGDSTGAPAGTRIFDTIESAGWCEGGVAKVTVESRGSDSDETR